MTCRPRKWARSRACAGRPNGCRASSPTRRSDGCWGLLPLDTFLGLRDYAMILTLYVTGLRAGEMIRMCTSHLVSDGMLYVQGKACRDRYVPLGAPLAGVLEGYLHARAVPSLACHFSVHWRPSMPHSRPLATEQHIAVLDPSIAARRGHRSPAHCVAVGVLLLARKCP